MFVSFSVLRILFLRDLNLRSKNKNQIVWYRQKIKVFHHYEYVLNIFKNKKTPLITQLTRTNNEKCCSSPSDFSVLSTVSKSKMTAIEYLLSMQSNNHRITSSWSALKLSLSLSVIFICIFF